jgi:FAT domain
MLTPAMRHISSSSCPKHMLANSKHMLVNPTWAQELDEQLIEEVLGHLRTATDTASGWAKSWHHWGLFNLALLGHHAAAREPAKAQQHVAPAVVGFFRSVALGQMEGRFFTGFRAMAQLVCNAGLYVPPASVPGVLAAGAGSVIVTALLTQPTQQPALYLALSAY